MKRVAAILMTILFLFLSSIPSLANEVCNENQTNIYVPQILFGESAVSHLSDEKIKMLMNALYLCSEQADNVGQEKLDYLKRKKVSNIPSLSSININRNILLECSHNSWEHELPSAKKKQKNRRILLQNTVNKIFDFGTLENIFGSRTGKCNSMAAMLYYLHILCDYLADDPYETEVNVKGEYVPPYDTKASININRNDPSFTTNEKRSKESFVYYSPLDSLGRACVVFANVGLDTVSSVGDRKKISFKPPGWNDKTYEGIVNSDPPSVYNICHLLAHQLGGEEKAENLITGTSYLNVSGMKIYEGRVARYIKMTNNHVLYRVTPIYKGDNLLASGVQLEAFSVEDAGKGIRFNVYCYNVQPGIHFDYENGKNDVSDNLTGKDNVLPFVVQNVSESNPDLIYEMNKHLEILFKDQKSSNKYINMTNRIKEIADEARGIETNGTLSQAQCYQKLKKQQYLYFETLKNYVPLLLNEEEYFKSAFK